MPDIGYYTLPVIASFDGIDAQVNKGMSKSLGRFGDFGKKSGQAFGKDLNAEIAAATKKSEELVRKSGANIVKLKDKEATAADKTRLAEEKLAEARKKGYADSRLTSARNNFAKAQRDEAAAVRATQAETNRLKTAQKDLATARKRVTDEFNKPLTTPSGKGFLSGISSEMSGVAGKFSSFGGGAGKGFVAGATAAILAGGLLAVGAKAAGLVVDGFQSIIDTGLDFSKTMNNFQGVTRASNEEMRKMQTTARTLGSDTTLAGASASDAALAMTELAKAGFTVDQAMSAARGTLELATAGQISAAQAAEIQSNAMNAFGIDAGQAAHVADVFANAAIGSSAGIPDLGLALQQVGGIAKGFGENLDDTIATLAMFSQAGVKGSDAGTLLKTTMQSITDQGNPAQGAIESLGLELYKLNEQTGDKQFVGFREMFRQLDEAKRRVGMTSEQFQAETNILFGSDAMRAAMLGNAEAFDTMLTKLGRVGGAAEMAKAQMQGLPGAVESFKNTAESIKLDAFDALGPAITTGLNQFVDFLSTHKSDIAGFFSMIGDAAFSMGKVVVSAFIGMASAGAAVARAFGADGVAKNLEFAQEAAEKAFGALEDGQQVLRDYTARAGEAAKLTDALGDSVTTLKTVGDDVTIDIKENTPDVEARLATLGLHLEAMANDPTKLRIVADTAEAEGPVNAFRQQQQGTPINIPFSVRYAPGQSVFPEWFKYIGGQAGPAPLPVSLIPAGPATPGPGVVSNPLNPNGILNPPRGGGRAAGGSIFGPGGPTSDQVPIMASAGEHMWTAGEVNAVGGQGPMYRLRAMAKAGMLKGFAGGGAVGGVVITPNELDRMGGGTVNLSILQALRGVNPGAVLTSAKTDHDADGGFHPRGQAIDVDPSQANLAALWAMRDQLSQIIFDDPQMVWYNVGGQRAEGAAARAIYGEATMAQHGNHIHVAAAHSVTGTGVVPRGMDTGPGSGTAMAFGGGDGGGGGVAGFGPGGEAGTFEVNQKQVREAEQKVAEADARVREEEASMRELKADAKESERIRAENQLAKAKQDASDARADLATAQQGEFKPGKTSKGGKGGLGGQGDLGPLGQIAGSFLKETFGLDGSWLPDIANLMPVKMAGTLLDTVMPMVSAYQDGSWTPGGLLGDAMGTSSAPFGIPDANVPPPGTAASGMGAGPAPGPVNVDQSINYHGPVGWDPAEIDARNRRAQNQRVQSRIPA